MDFKYFVISFDTTIVFNRYSNEYIILIKLPVLAHKNETLVVYFDTAVSYLKVGLVVSGY